MEDEIALMTLPPLENGESLITFPAKWDFVLVCDEHSPDSEKHFKKKWFLEELHRKGFIIKMIKDKKLFYGIHAPSAFFRKYQWLLRNSENHCELLCGQQLDDQEMTSSRTRIRLVSFILQNTEICSTKEKLDELIKKKVFETAFPLHEREWLKTFQMLNWARWRGILKGQQQPIEKIRMYFGEKIALYFAWLGWYTCILLAAAIPGIVLFIYGFLNFSSSPVSKEICAANSTIMCPLCDQKCPFWRLSDTCIYSKVTHLLDNEGTVFFAIFMALWATVFLELWKRRRARVVSKWNLFLWDEEEEEVMMEVINNPEHDPQPYQHSYMRSTVVLILVLLMICVLIGIAHALVIYRVIVTVIFMQSSSGFFRELATTMAVITGAVLHYLTIIIMSKVNRCVALFLCDLEKPRSFTEREKNFAVKYFTFQFFTHFSSLIYIAFFLGRINGRPGNYVRVGGKWRLEECHPSGCLIDLFMQLTIIMTLKQTLSNLVEYMLPWIRYRYRLMNGKTTINSRDHREETEQDPCKEEWLWNYQLNEVNSFSVFNEFMEMMIQYSFTTIFVAAFPLAPLLACINNVFEIRLDAIKMVKLQRRMVPRKANDIGIWLYVLEAIGILAVIGNGLVIAITSDFIPMQVYKYIYGPCLQKNNTGVDCMTGYINYSLSVFSVQDFENYKNLVDLQDSMGNEIKYCRYRDYRNSDDYGYSVQFWHVLAARLAFLILFEHVALCIKLIAAWYVPDVPRRVKNCLLEGKRERLLKRLREMDDSTEV
ncbi:anoctamin-9 [Varanus komodoensis]|uniref:anoctamin-9 n=1 Tax=Varanus komodoensis TaxID=61221 RepID=UPI001CF76F8A|nr:anoctamin-9 [Varanus komodoensis]